LSISPLKKIDVNPYILQGKCHADFSAVLRDAASAPRQKHEPTKLECGLLGALLASTSLAFMFWLSIQLSLITLFIR
jgi:hypothetical protein